MEKWLTHAVQALAARAVPLLAALAVAALAAAGWLDAERAALVRCVLTADAPRLCASSSSPNPVVQLLGPSVRAGS